MEISGFFGFRHHHRGKRQATGSFDVGFVPFRVRAIDAQQDGHRPRHGRQPFDEQVAITASAPAAAALRNRSGRSAGTNSGNVRLAISPGIGFSGSPLARG
jgi:hypothetical protein